jgi:hypothetical protein
MKIEGLFRIKGDPNMVWYTDGDIERKDMTEEEYRRGTYEPPFDDLPWTN